MTPPPSSAADFRRFLQSAERSQQLVSVAFAFAVVLLAVGAWQVWQAGERHRRTADEALQDQASYLSGSMAMSVQNNGWFAGRTLLRAWDETLRDPHPWPTTDSIRRRAVAEAIGPDMPDLQPTRFFVGDSLGWRTTNGPPSPDDPVIAAIRKLPRTLISAGAFRMVVIPHDADTCVVFLMAAAHPLPGAAIFGFQTTVAQFRTAIIMPWIEMATKSFNRLRDSMAHPPAKSGSDLPLAISIVTNDSSAAVPHVPLYRTDSYPKPPWMGMHWIEGGLASEIAIAIRPEGVPILIQSGYPVRHTALLIGVFLLGVALITLAAMLVRRTLIMSRQREEFTSSVSHELRTPLTNIQLFAETLLMDRARTPEERHSALETITRETRRLVHMVENVLSLSRIGRPAETLVRRTERVDQLVRDVLYSFDPMMRSRNIEVELRFEGSETAFVDGDAVRRILVNLLDNAIRYGPPGQTLHVSAINRAGHLDLAVEDEGPGVPAADRDRVWQAFERGSTNRDSGTGIGLAVVDQLVRLHGGSARIEDGLRGARVVVALPTPETVM